MAHRWQPRFLGCIAACLAALAALGFSHSFWWVADLVIHFRPQFAFISALFLLLTWCMRLPRVSVVFLVMLALHATPIIPAWLAARPVAMSLQTSAAPDISIVFHNVKIDNENPAATVAADATAAPDVLIFIEASEALRVAVAERKTDYPYQFPEAGNHQFETVIAGKRPMITTVHHFGDLDRFVVLSTLEITPQHTITLAVIHPVSPKTAFHTRIRDEHLRRLGVFLKSLPGDVILLGDHNITPWHPLYQETLRSAGLTNWRASSFWDASWNDHAPPFTRVPIDLVATRGSLVLKKLASPASKQYYSDHSPQLVGVDFNTP